MKELTPTLSILASTMGISVTMPAIAKVANIPDIVALTKKADAGDANAQFELAKYAGDDEKTLFLLKKAIEQGHGEAAFILGRAYLFGNNKIEEDYNQAKRLFKRSCDSGYDNGCKAYDDISQKSDQEIRKELTEAFDFKRRDAIVIPSPSLLKKAADQGHGEAAFILGKAYLLGDKVEEDYDQARQLFKRSCDNGYDDGCEAYKYMSQKSDQEIRKELWGVLDPKRQDDITIPEPSKH